MTDGPGQRRGAHRAGRRTGGEAPDEPVRHWPDEPYPRAPWWRRTLASPLADPLLRSIAYSAVAVALVAALIAVVWVVSGDQSGRTAAPTGGGPTEPTAGAAFTPPAASVAPSPARRTPSRHRPSVRPAPASARPHTTPPPTTAPPTTAPPTTAPATTRPAVVRAPVLVLNNSRVPHLAAKAAADFRAGGWPIAGTGNYTGRIPATTVYYAPGRLAAARALAAQFPAITRVLPSSPGLPGASGLTVVVTRYYPH